jgi:hypothetical protein
MINHQVMNAIFISIISLVLSISTFAKPEPKNALSTPESQLPLSSHASILKNVIVSLKGINDTEQRVLNQLSGMVKNILKNTQLGEVKILVLDTSSLTPVMKVVEKLEIMIEVKTSVKTEQPHQVSVTLQEPGIEGIPYFFDYQNSLDEIYANLKDYLTTHLNLQPIATNISQEVKEEFQSSVLVVEKQTLSSQTVKKSQSTLSVNVNSQLPIRKIEPQPVLPKRAQESQPVLSVKVESKFQQLDKQSVSLQKDVQPSSKMEEPLSTQKKEPLSSKKEESLFPQKEESLSPQKEEPFSSNKEMQLKNISPVIKTISVRIRGTQRVQDVLNTVYTMVSDILSSSKLGVVRIPVFNDPVITPVVKVSEKLEIVITATSPIEEQQFYKIGITLQPEGAEGKPQWFEYNTEDSEYFLQDLRVYLTRELNLQPK